MVKDIFVYDYFKHENRSIGNFVKSVWKTFSICKRNKINIIHSHSHYAANFAHLASRLLGIKTIQSIHGIIPVTGRLPHYKADKFIAVNEHIISYIGTCYPNIIGKIHLVNVGYNFPEELPKKSYDNVRIIAGSRLSREKGIDTFIEAVKYLPEEIKKSCSFLIAGTGPEESEFRNMAIGTPIQFLGVVHNFEQLLATTHIFVIPSRSKAEGFPTAIIQAAKTGNLIISSNFWGSESILKNNSNALIFDKDSFRSLAELMIKTATNLSNFTGLVNNCFTEFKDKFDSTKSTTELMRLYKEL
ncbi:MAG: glycosyltransferase family 4 protein [Ignavibacteriaceae bacterium]|nr:glycosyltransferase family 4 protein [Ignavibacteriaceae bacterium]